MQPVNPDLHPLGAAGPLVSRLGLGLAALGRPGYINLGHAADLDTSYAVEAMRAGAYRVLDAAFRQGIRYFDAARSYGRAEEFLGGWLVERGLNSDAVVVGSKWGYTYTADWQVRAAVHEVKEHSLEVLRRQWGESCGHLGSALRLYQIHSATLDSGVLDNTAVLGELARLKSQGVAIGLSVSGLAQRETIQRALTLESDGRRLFDCVQVTWNLLEVAAAPALAEARASGLGVIVKEALANGRLTARSDSRDFASGRERLEEQARRLHTTRDALALAAALAQPWADVILSGASTVAQLESNARALDVAWDEEAALALAVLAEPPEQYWTIRKNLPWN